MPRTAPATAALRLSARPSIGIVTRRSQACFAFDPAGLAIRYPTMQETRRSVRPRCDNWWPRAAMRRQVGPHLERSQTMNSLQLARSDALGENRAHAGAHRLNRKRIGAVVDQDKSSRADRVAGAQHGAQVARIAHRLRHQPDRRGCAVYCGERGIEFGEDARDRLRDCPCR